MKLTVSQLVNKFPAFYGTRRVITRLYYYLPIYACVSQFVFFRQVNHHNLYAFLLSPVRSTCPAHLILRDLITSTIFAVEYKPSVSSIWSPSVSCDLSLLGPSVSLSTLFSNALSLYCQDSLAHAPNVTRPIFSNLLTSLHFNHYMALI